MILVCGVKSGVISLEMFQSGKERGARDVTFDDEADIFVNRATYRFVLSLDLRPEESREILVSE